MQAKITSTTNRRRPEDAATIGLMILKATFSGLDNSMTPAKSTPKSPVLAGGAVMEAA